MKRIGITPFFFFCTAVSFPNLHSFPTRRSSDLATVKRAEHAGATIREATSTFVSGDRFARSEEHTSELQSRGHLVCRLLLEKKKRKSDKTTTNSSITVQRVKNKNVMYSNARNHL